MQNQLLENAGFRKLFAYSYMQQVILDRRFLGYTTMELMQVSKCDYFIPSVLSIIGSFLFMQGGSVSQKDYRIAVSNSVFHLVDIGKTDKLFADNFKQLVQILQAEHFEMVLQEERFRLKGSLLISDGLNVPSIQSTLSIQVDPGAIFNSIAAIDPVFASDFIHDAEILERQKIFAASPIFRACSAKIGNQEWTVERNFCE